MAAVLYIVFVRIVQSVVPGRVALKRVLGFARPVIDTPLPSNLVVDIATVSEGNAPQSPSAPSKPVGARVGGR